MSVPGRYRRRREIRGTLFGEIIVAVLGVLAGWLTRRRHDGPTSRDGYGDELPLEHDDWRYHR